jgi:hypothetical protein
MTLHLTTSIEEITRHAALIFDLEDRYARDIGLRGPHPRPLGQVNFTALGWMVGGVRQDFAVELELKMIQNQSGYHLFFNEVLAPGGKTLHNLLAENRTYVISLSGDLYQPITLEDVDLPLPLPRTPYPVALEPSYRYPFYQPGILPKNLAPTLLRGSLKSPDGSGIKAAKITLTHNGSQYRYETDSSGQWVNVIMPPPAPPPNLLPLNATLRVDFMPATIRQGGMIQTGLTLPDGTRLAHAPIQAPPGQATISQALQFT